MKGYISNIQKFSVNDGAGIRTIVFLLGCTLQCRWCQNPETLKLKPNLMFAGDLCKGCQRCKKVCPKGRPQMMNNQGIIDIDRSQCIRCFACVQNCPYEAMKASGKEMTVEEVFQEVMKDKVFYRQSGGGITVSGGEPLMQVDFTAKLLEMVKGENISTCIETAGHVPWTFFKKVLPYTDIFLFDVKLLNEDLHKEWTGADNRQILSNLKLLAKPDKEVIIRIPLIPGVNDGREFEAIIEYVAALESIREIHILPFHQLGSSKYDQMGMEYSMKEVTEDNGEMVSRCQKYAEEKGFRVNVGGSGF